ncbi:Ras family protein [Histomonas meleagridis]|uniref:Ras family protein n=1 Tax=Histomonas meleagridis TaxID=135588 RepID=UPI00355A3F7E|nr:Ras family protein [Histomonas meleagridis]KAH0802072.1 Ras family protein [Histomonas meleagridis]
MQVLPSTLCHKAVFIGDSSVGKTSIIYQFIFNSCSPDQQATIGIDFFSKTISKGEEMVRLQIWDTAGQEKFHSLIPSYIRGSTIAILTYDITSRTSFENLHKWHQIILNTSIPTLFVVGNKLDLDSEREVLTEEGEKFASGINASFIEVSAKTAENVEELFSRVAAVPMKAEEEAPAQKYGGSTETIAVKVGDDNMQIPPKSGCGC